MKWTSEPPKEPGWYWYKDPSETPSVAYVYDKSHGSLMIENCPGPERSMVLTFHPDRTRGLWSGPIPEPEE